MNETEKSYQQKVQARQAALNGELEQSSKFAELRAMHFRAFLNMRSWWMFWQTPARLFQRAHDCARLDYLVRVDEAAALHVQLGEGMRAPAMVKVLNGEAAPTATTLQLAQTVQ